MTNDVSVKANEAKPAARTEASLLPPVDVIEDAQGITLFADLPGVPKDKVTRLRMKLAEANLPKGGGVGYEIFDKSDALGTTSFVQNINHLRALEGELARTIRASGETLLGVINDVLDFSKADVGKLEIEQQRFDLRRCVEDALDGLAWAEREGGLPALVKRSESNLATLAAWVERIRGSHSGIMGLPLFETARLLERAGVAQSLQP